MLAELINLLFPSVCGICGRLNKNYLCLECEKQIDAKIIYNEIRLKNKYFDKHIYLMPYDGIIREKILSYKFHDKSYMYKTFSKIILNNKKLCKILETYDIIIDIPIHKKRKSTRGYNQSELIAKEIAKNIENLKYVKGLNKIKNTKRQSSLSKVDRFENVKNAYEIANKEIICDKRIVLFDDIYTTRCNSK